MPSGSGAVSSLGSVGICPVRNTQPSTSTACEKGATGAVAPAIMRKRAALIAARSFRGRGRIADANLVTEGREISLAHARVVLVGEQHRVPGLLADLRLCLVDDGVIPALASRPDDDLSHLLRLRPARDALLARDLGRGGRGDQDGENENHA